MEGNTPGRGSGVPGEEAEGLENYSMTPSDKELVRAAREDSTLWKNSTKLIMR